MSNAGTPKCLATPSAELILSKKSPKNLVKSFTIYSITTYGSSFFDSKFENTIGKPGFSGV